VPSREHALRTVRFPVSKPAIIKLNPLPGLGNRDDER
jgi:hypothetical protein